MALRSVPASEHGLHRPAMARTYRSISALADAGLLDPTPGLAAVAERYAVAVTADLVALINRDDPGDPIARQFIPDERELDLRPEENGDPIGDGRFTPVKGIVHRYPDRVLLKPLLACPVYCRFCFRREMVGPGGEALHSDELAAALDYVRSDSRIWEVILTGGDPLMLAPRRIAEITAALGAIDHVRVIRWHSRVPVIDASRVTPELVAAITGTEKSVWLALHSNHPRELTTAARRAIKALRLAGVELVSQTVLLKGVNDDPDILAALMRGFVENGVKPYYLHHADLAPGTSHFRTTIAEGQAIMRALRGRLSGLAQPTYVLDIPGGFGKVPAGPVFVEQDGTIAVDSSGAPHAYPPGMSDR